MAINFVGIDRNAKFGSVLVDLSNTLRRARELAAATQERMGHMNDGTNFAPICTFHGISPADNANGSDALAVINAVVTALNAGAVTNMIERVG